jgi:lysophospholipase L1-like esterase
VVLSEHARGMKQLGLLACVALALAGCLEDTDNDGIVRIACIGDSNTWSGWPGDGTDRWCQFLAALQPTILTVPDLIEKPTEFLSSSEPQGYTLSACYDPVLSQYYGWGVQRVAEAKTQLADNILVALGTNDIRVLHRTPAEIIACLQAVVAAAAPLRTFIATIPPDHSATADPVTINQTNALIVTTFPASKVIDFSTGFGPEYFDADGVHLNDAGQQLRALRAQAKL